MQRGRWYEQERIRVSTTPAQTRTLDETGPNAISDAKAQTQTIASTLIHIISQCIWPHTHHSGLTIHHDEEHYNTSNAPKLRINIGLVWWSCCRLKNHTSLG
jgi:hypothetical protein